MKKLLLSLLFFISFTLTTHAQVSITGEAVGGWGDGHDFDMTTTDGVHWFYSTLICNNAASGGGIIFRMDHNWSVNWGALNWPSGTGVQGGGNIQCTAGAWDVTFNSSTGEYAFNSSSPVSTVSLVGAGITTPMTTTNGENYSITNITLPTADFQFNIDGNLYGSTTFPTGSLSDVSLFIPGTAGTYNISVNIATGDYNFAAIPTNPTISITGTAVGGWGDGFDFDMQTTDNITYHYYGLVTTDGQLKFRTDHQWVTSYAGTGFPNGTSNAAVQEINVFAGNWDVTFNRINGNYSFISTTTAAGVSLVGSGIDGWPGSAENPGPIDIHQMTTADNIHYTLYNVALTNGEVKFRQDNQWTINWGAPEFPSGVGVANGANIVTIAGNYTVNFNRVTGEYSFVAPLRMAIVGSAVGGWPTGALGEVDAHQLESTDGINFNLDEITFTNGFVKFRANNNWDLNWGGTSLEEVLVLNGPEIPVTAGSYSISVNRIMGSYALGEPLGVKAINKGGFKVAPNPTNGNWNFSAPQRIETIQIFDVLGKQVLQVSPKSMTAIINASDLTSGIYVAKINTLGSMQTITLVKH